MGHHTFDAADADRLEDPATRYRYLSEEELLGPLGSPETTLEVGSGTGFYTDSLSRVSGRVVAVDLQAAMHARYRANGVPRNVSPVVGVADRLPLATDGVDAAATTMTHHEVGSPGITELFRVLRPGGRIVVADWSAAGTGDAGPPVDERFSAGEVREHLAAAGFAVERVADRLETLLAVARVPTDGDAPGR